MTGLCGLLINYFIKTALPILAALFLGLQTSVTNAEIQLTFGTYTADKPTTTVKKYKPFLDYLAQEMSEILEEPVFIKMKIASDYEAGINQLVSGKVDFARFGPASYVTAFTRNDGIRIIAMEAKKGKKRFKGVIVVHADNEMQTLAELSQHSFAFGSELSTIGRYLAQSYLIQAGVTSNDLSNYAYLGRHDRVGMAVGSGKFTAGALKESTFKKLVEQGVPLRPLFEFDNVTKPWIAAVDLDPAVTAAMRQVMLSAEDKEAIQNVSKGGFLTGTDSDFNLIREAMIQSERF
ncbi:Phosphate-import protein PhnD precursor [Roseovarius albus]|uniref:Phosphate-import protein PhnD n=2 Tax=Roseovarius albus TaxID=1247867 RepID=A0A1X6Z6Y7_9RHOB|nr:Phosphate-import protein PhnD precursor [Roseovarius albus]